MSQPGYIPPQAPLTDGRLYVCLPIPDDTRSRQAFMGALYNLSQVWGWSGEAPEEDRFASADYWQTVLQVAGAQLNARYTDCGDLVDCQKIIDCLSSGAGAAFLNGSVNQSGGYSETTNLWETYVTQEARDKPIQAPPPGCDRDMLWSGIRYLVARLDELGRDILQDLISYTIPARKVVGIVEAIPVVGDLGALALNNAVDLLPDLLTLYEAYSSEANMDDMACEIFELVCEECRYPTFEELIQVYANWSVKDLLTNPTPADVLEVITLAPTLPAETAYRSFHQALLFTLSVAGRVFDWYGVDVITLYISLGEDLPTDNWEVLCGGCGEQQDIVIPFTQANSSNFVLQCGIQDVHAIYGIGGCEFNPSSYSAIVNWYAPAPITLNAGDYVEVDGLWNANGGRALYVDFWLGGTLLQQFQLSPLLGSQLEGVNFTGTFDRIKLQYSNGASSNGRLDTLAVRFGT